MATKKITISVDEELYNRVKYKCKYWGIGTSTLIKLFLRAFVSQKGAGFYVGDHDLVSLFNRWIIKKRLEKGRKGCAPLPGPRLKDLFEL